MRKDSIGIVVRALLIYPGDINLYTKGRLGHCRVLFTQRAKDKSTYPSKWELPGGRVEYMEPLETALNREILEEVGVQLDWAAPKPYMTEHIQPSDNGHWLSFTYWCGYSGVAPYIREPDKCIDMRWVPLRYAQELDLMTPVSNLIQDIRYEWINS